LERIKKAPEDEREAEVDGDDIDRLPASPYPMKKTTAVIDVHDEALIPKFNLNTTGSHCEANDSANISVDPFASGLQDESILSHVQNHGASSVNDESTDAPNLSVGGSEGSPSRLVVDLQCSDKTLNSEQASSHIESTPPRLQKVHHPSLAVVENHAVSVRCTSSPTCSASPIVALGSSQERIPRGEVERRFLAQRTQSPAFDEVLRSFSSSVEPSVCETTLEAVNVSDEKLDCQLPQELLERDQDKDRMSVLTTRTDISTETAIVERVEKRTMGLTTLGKAPDHDFGMLGPSQFDFGSNFSFGGLGVSASNVSVTVGSLDNPNLRTMNPRM